MCSVNEHLKLQNLRSSVLLVSFHRLHYVNIMKTTKKKFMSSLLLLFIYVCIENTMGEKCLPTSFHKMRSSPANTEYLECKAWSSDTCCTANFTTQLNKTRLRDLYGFHWGHCKNISQVSFLISSANVYLLISYNPKSQNLQLL